VKFCNIDHTFCNAIGPKRFPPSFEIDGKIHMIIHEEISLVEKEEEEISSQACI
jgi:hypothetical protein